MSSIRTQLFSDGAYDIDPLGLDEDSEVTRFEDGSAQIEDADGNITRYIPAPEDGGEGAVISSRASTTMLRLTRPLR